MKTQEEIINKIEVIKNDDFFGTKRGDLVDALTFKNAKPFLQDDLPEDFLQDDLPEDIEEKWAEITFQNDEQIIAKIIDHLPLAWGKANDCQGLSAGRSMNHFYAWLWLLGEDELAEETEEYELYGKPQLVKISEKYNFDWEKHDDDRWANDEYSNGVTAEEYLGLIQKPKGD